MITHALLCLSDHCHHAHGDANADAFQINADHRVGLYANRVIESGEELTFNYSYSDEHVAAIGGGAGAGAGAGKASASSQRAGSSNGNGNGNGSGAKSSSSSSHKKKLGLANKFDGEDDAAKRRPLKCSKKRAEDDVSMT